ncbi:MAG: OmpH family outer membrane protein [Bacteroidota bacterium]
MVKNINLLLNVIALIAITVLFVLFFSNKKECNVSKKGIDGPLNIAYVNSDTLWKKYDFVKEIESELDTFETSLQASYNTKASAFEKAYTDFMKKGQAGLLSAIEQETQGKKLSAEQESLMKLNQELTTKLNIKTQELNNKVQDTILSVLRKYNKKTNYTFIMQYTKAGAILVASDSLDITEDVIKTLNEEYKGYRKK